MRDLRDLNPATINAMFTVHGGWPPAEGARHRITLGHTGIQTERRDPRSGVAAHPVHPRVSGAAGTTPADPALAAFGVVGLLMVVFG